MKPLHTFETFVNESKDSDALAKGIAKAINAVDDSLSYSDFALAISKILKEEYGDHNFKPFMDILKKELGQ